MTSQHGQYYCTVQEFLTDLGKEGDVDMVRALGFVRSASQFIIRQIGTFIPITEARDFDGNQDKVLRVDPLVSHTALTLDGTAKTEGKANDYVLYGKSSNLPHWPNGPSTRLKRVSGVWPAADGLGIVTITGDWGLYKETETLITETITLVAAGTATMLASAGNVFQVGMVCIIESEVIAIIGISSTTTDSTSLADGAITKTDEVITVDDASDFAVGEIIQIDLEDMKVMQINETSEKIYVLRGYNNTPRATHIDDSIIYIYQTYNISRGLNGTTAAIHTAKAIAKYWVPGDINMLARELAGLSMKKADTGFAGRESNAELGQTFYFNQYPKHVIKAIKKNYYIHNLGGN